MKYKVTLIKSPLGYNYKTRLVVNALGLKRLNKTIEVDGKNLAHMGMVNKIKHVLEIKEI